MSYTRTDLVGKSYANIRGEKYTVKEYMGFDKYHISLYKVEFENGYTGVATSSNIVKGWVKNRLAKRLYGIGFIGQGSLKTNPKEYRIWAAMLQRCYDPSCDSYKNYGGKGILVAEEWHCFGTFLKDIHALGYDGILVLDKDIKSGPTKVYSKDTCSFIPAALNTSLASQASKVITIWVIPPDGAPFKVTNYKKFARENGFAQQGICGCIGGRIKTHRGYSFKRCND